MTSRTGASRAVMLMAVLGLWALMIALLLVLPQLAAAEGPVGPSVAPPGSARWWATAAVLTAQSGALLVLRSAPRTTLLVIAALALGLGAVAPGVAYTLSHLPVVGAVFLVTPRRPWPQMRGTLVLTACAVAVGSVLNGLRSGLATLPAVLGEALVQGVGVVGLTALVALALASIRTAREAQRRERAALDRERGALTREREALQRAAASEERAAMARELHDIAAHHLSGIALVAAAADRQIETDPQSARDSVRQVRGQTRAVLDDIRRVVGLLRGGEEAERTVESLETIPELVRARAATGMEVRFAQHPESDGREPGAGIGPLGQLVAYRMVQESLTNAAEHAPGAHCLVTVDDTDPVQLTVTVRDDGAGTPQVPSPAAPGGFGLVGMRERAGLVGGALEHGPETDGGWRVHLRLPRDRTVGPAGDTLREGRR